MPDVAVPLGEKHVLCSGLVLVRAALVTAAVLEAVGLSVAALVLGVDWRGEGAAQEFWRCFRALLASIGRLS